MISQVANLPVKNTSICLYILIIFPIGVKHYSWWIFLDMLWQRTFISRWVSYFSVPVIINTSRSQQFKSNLFCQFMKVLDNERIWNMACHSEANGMVKSFHHSLRAMLKWLEHLPFDYWVISHIINAWHSLSCLPKSCIASHWLPRYLLFYMTQSHRHHFIHLTTMLDDSNVCVNVFSS